MIGINTILFLARDRQQTWLSRAAHARLAKEAQAGQDHGTERSWHIPHLSLRSLVESVLHSHTGPTQQPCVTCG